VNWVSQGLILGRTGFSLLVLNFLIGAENQQAEARSTRNACPGYEESCAH
jgi:hypothetical protein